MSKIPTAEEMIQAKNGDDYTHWEEIHDLLIEFAKLHVKAALEAAASKATCTAYFPPKKMEYDENDKLILKDEEASYVFPVQGGSKWIDIKKSSILNAYPDNLIQ